MKNVKSTYIIGNSSTGFGVVLLFVESMQAVLPSIGFILSRLVDWLPLVNA
jgi:hypothetical protein